MAEEKRLREGDGFYRQLNEANSGELLWGGIQKRKKTRRNGDPTFYPVERVVSRQINNGKTQYLLKWTGYSAYESSWVDEDDLSADLVRHVFYKIASERIPLSLVSAKPFELEKRASLKSFFVLFPP
ncbi:predicted protein [Nematostella vectensis]|uniref:Chromo domain-containing protein n=1 Tax=Nematostella vectensis TaxID=45351 RepID=A7RUL1_NEMVE|nr:predicted protein [Nematostella vectensis]EDO44922.1 predicted protein [Nematostella vectensis]|eukprot:XP_001619792.1 hypothetical protein NEMVEDRAFT_v1g223820 [Nematostella vectensis]